MIHASYGGVVMAVLESGRKYFLCLAAMLIVVCVAGCKDDDDDGPSCPSACERSKRCDGSALADTECADYCEGIAAVNEHAGCTELFESLLACANSVRDVCSGDVCAEESKDWSDCFGVYCDTHLEECSALFE
jgi:hypothetical protein